MINFIIIDKFYKYMTKITPKILASLIDHTQLMPFATKQDIKKLCEEAAEL